MMYDMTKKYFHHLLDWIHLVLVVKVREGVQQVSEVLEINFKSIFGQKLGRNDVYLMDSTQSSLLMSVRGPSLSLDFLPRILKVSFNSEVRNFIRTCKIFNKGYILHGHKRIPLEVPFHLYEFKEQDLFFGLNVTLYYII